MEDHELLYGQISIVGLDHPEHYDRFESLFKCDWDLGDCALFTLGDYKQKERNGWRYQLGASMRDGFAWKTLFHKSENLTGFENTKQVLNKLLESASHATNDYLKGLIDSFVRRCENNKEFPWTYYYMKYDVFRTGRYGKYWWNDFDKSPYVFTTIYQSKNASENSYNPFLKAVNINVSREHYGNRIRLNDVKFLRETQSSYQVVSNDENKDVQEEINITQDENGIDTENRIEKMKSKFLTL